MIQPETLPMMRTLEMNDTHFETMMLINRLSAAVENGMPETVGEVLNELMEHTLEHCKREEAMMLEKGFPPYYAHKEEHDLALGDMRSAIEGFEKTHNIDEVRTYVETNLEPWFLRHTETMDQVTSMFLENSEVHLEFWKKLKPRNS